MVTDAIDKKSATRNSNEESWEDEDEENSGSGDEDEEDTGSGDKNDEYNTVDEAKGGEENYGNKNEKFTEASVTGTATSVTGVGTEELVNKHLGMFWYIHLYHASLILFSDVESSGCPHESGQGQK